MQLHAVHAAINELFYICVQWDLSNPDITGPEEKSPDQRSALISEVEPLYILGEGKCVPFGEVSL